MCRYQLPASCAAVAMASSAKDCCNHPWKEVKQDFLVGEIIKATILGEVKKKYMFSVPAHFLFWGRLLFSSFFLFEKTVKKTRKIRSFSNFFFFFFFFFGGKDRMLYRKIAFYIFRLPHQLFHLLWKLSRMSGGHLEKIGRPVVLENVSGGHFEEEKEKKKKRLLLPFFHRGRTLNMFCFFLLRLIPFNIKPSKEIQG